MNDGDKLPKYMQIAQYFKKEIEEGKISPGEKLLSENEMVEKFKVSRHTIRQALMELEKEKYIFREQGKGTFCSNIKTEDSTKKKTIAVLTTYISNYIFPSIISGIEEVLSSLGYSLLLFNTNNEKVKEGECLKKIMEYEVVGLIVEPTMSALENINLKYYEMLNDKNIPYIMINASYEGLDSPRVVMDDVEGGYVLTKYLLQLGHRNIAGIFKDDDMQGVNRRKGYEKALSEFNITIDNSNICRYETKEDKFSPYEFAINLLSGIEKPTAIVCYNDQVAMHVLQAVRDQGLSVPEDISVVSYDDSYLSTATEVKLTTVRHPKDEMGRRAARLLVGMIEGRIEKPYYVYRPELIVRSSAINLK